VIFLKDFAYQMHLAQRMTEDDVFCLSFTECSHHLNHWESGLVGFQILNEQKKAIVDLIQAENEWTKSAPAAWKSP
jgi:hypothetical protein